MSTDPSIAPSSTADRPVATGFDLEPLPNGDVLIEFFGDDGKTFNTQVITRTSLAQFPAIVHAFFLFVESGEEAATEFISRLNAEKDNPHGGDSGTTDHRSGGEL